METTETQKIYCMPQHDNSAMLAELINAKSQGVDAATMSALFSRRDNGGWMNNPFMYLIWLAFFGGNGFGWGGNRADVAQNADLARQMQTLQGTVTDNHNNDLALQAINGNTSAIRELAQTMNCDFNSMMTAVNTVKSAIDSVSGQIGYTSESIKNAIALGDSNIMSKMQDCCCQQKQLIIEQGYQNQLANERQTNVLQSSIEGVRQATVNGFAQIGYQMASDKAEILRNNDYQTQRILDQMCANTTQELRDAIAQKDRELQTQSIINQMKGGCGCNC